MLFGIYDLISNGFFKEETRIVAIHTGGLQGLNGLESKKHSIYKRNLKTGLI
jgi:1-aminocyclopropane-1-carboxylate deaminase